MLMLMRSEGNDAVVDCEDPMTVIACTTDTDACPAKCRESDEPTIVKAGDLAVSAKAAEGRKVRVPGVSDLDTLTFKASEKVTISKVVLERYGYSDSDLVDEVRLEDEDGNVIADGKGLSKDKATLSIKKDYRDTDGTLRATVVVRTTGDKVGGTLGFKVVDVDSSAKNLNLDDYTPYTYDTVQYSGADVTVTLRGTSKDYNYEEGESYEIARLKVQAGKSSIAVRGFTLTNTGTIDMADYLDKLTVKVDNEDVAGLKYSVNKDEQLVISFDEMTIDMNKSALFVISASLEDFDDYGHDLSYYLEQDSDINAVEKKTGARLTVTRAWTPAAHKFNGGKIRLANDNPGDLEASQATEGLVVAEGTITVTEPISKLSFDVSANNTWVAALKMFVNGEEYEGKKSAIEGGYKFAFSNVEIEKSWKIQFKLDIEDNESVTWDVVLTKNFNRDAFKWARYDNSRKDVQTGDVSGSITFSKVTIKAAGASLKNKTTTAAQFMTEKTTSDVVVFDGIYSAKKSDINLNKFYIVEPESNKFAAGVSVTYELYLNDKFVASTDLYGEDNAETFADVAVAAGESVNVVVKATAEVYDFAGTTGTAYSGYKLGLGGTDNFDKDIENKEAKLVNMKIVEEGSVNLSAGATTKTVLYKGVADKTLAQFTIKPGDGVDSVEIKTLSFNLVWSDGSDELTTDDVDVTFGKSDLEAKGEDDFTYENIKETITGPVTVTVALNDEFVGTYALSGITVNGKSLNKEYLTRFENAVVRIAAQEDLGWTTKFTFNVKVADDYEVSDLVISAENDLKWEVEGLVDSSSFVEINNTQETNYNVLSISYLVCDTNATTVSPAAGGNEGNGGEGNGGEGNGGEGDDQNLNTGSVDLETVPTGCKRVTIYRSTTGDEPGFSDFFLVNGTYAKVFKK